MDDVRVDFVQENNGTIVDSVVEADCSCTNEFVVLAVLTALMPELSVDLSPSRLQTG